MKDVLIYKYTKATNNRFNIDSFLMYRYHKLFFCSLMKSGKKLKAFYLFNQLKYKLKLLENLPPLEVFLTAMFRITPSVLLYAKKMANVTYGVPLYISENKKFTYATKWVLKSLKDKNKKVTMDNIAETLVLSIYLKGPAAEKLEAVYYTADEHRHMARFFK